jgi:hypothetical protein
MGRAEGVVYEATLAGYKFRFKLGGGDAKMFRIQVGDRECANAFDEMRTTGLSEDVMAASERSLTDTPPRKKRVEGRCRQADHIE